MSAPKCLFFQGLKGPDRSFDQGYLREPNVGGISVPKTSYLRILNIGSEKKPISAKHQKIFADSDSGTTVPGMNPTHPRDRWMKWNLYCAIQQKRPVCPRHDLSLSQGRVPFVTKTVHVCAGHRPAQHAHFYQLLGDRFLSSAGTGKSCALSMRVPNPSPALDKHIVHPWVQKFYPVPGLGSGGRLLKRFPDSSSVVDKFRNCLEYVRSNSVPSRLLPNSCLLNPGRAAQDRIELRGSFLDLF